MTAGYAAIRKEEATKWPPVVSIEYLFGNDWDGAVRMEAPELERYLSSISGRTIHLYARRRLSRAAVLATLRRSGLRGLPRLTARPRFSRGTFYQVQYLAPPTPPA